MRVKIFYLLIFITLIVLLYCSVTKAFNLKVFCVFSSIAILFLTLTGTIKHVILKYLYIFIFSLFLPLSVLEGYYYILGVDRAQIKTTTTPEKINEYNAITGYTPIKSSQIHEVSTFAEDTVIYDTIYTINAQGCRISPNAPHARTAIVLFGCSFAFGFGINDEDTFAWKLGEALGNQYQVINFAYNGYGPHQMLALLENGLPQLKNYDNILVYYMAIDDHILRVTGIRRWDTDGPRYLIEEGRAVYKGTFADSGTFFWEGFLNPYFKYSFLFRALEMSLVQKALIYNKEKNIALTCAIINRSAEIVRRDYLKSKFTILFYPPNTAQMLLPALNNIPNIDLEPWFPNYMTHQIKYELLFNSHPNVLANDIVAKHLLPIIQQDVATLSNPE